MKRLTEIVLTPILKNTSCGHASVKLQRK